MLLSRKRSFPCIIGSRRFVCQFILQNRHHGASNNSLNLTGGLQCLSCFTFRPSPKAWALLPQTPQSQRRWPAPWSWSLHPCRGGCKRSYQSPAQCSQWAPHPGSIGHSKKRFRNNSSERVTQRSGTKEGVMSWPDCQDLPETFPLHTYLTLSASWNKSNLKQDAFWSFLEADDLTLKPWRSKEPYHN